MKYDAVLAGEVKIPDSDRFTQNLMIKDFAYTSAFVSSEIVKWNVETREVVDRMPVYYSVGHLTIPSGDSRKPWESILYQ